MNERASYSSDIDVSARQSVLVVGLATIAVLAAGLIVPGGGLVTALLLSVTALRTHPAAGKILIALGVVLLMLVLGVNALPWTNPRLHVGIPEPAGSGR